MAEDAAFVKNTTSKLDYAVDWTEWLEGDQIAESSWSVPEGLTVEVSSHTDTKAVIWLSGGTFGESYELTNSIVTAGGREESRSILIIMARR